MLQQKQITREEETELTLFQEVFGDSVRIRVLEFFLVSAVAYPVEALIEDKEIGKSQAYEIVKDLLDKEYIVMDHIYKKRRYYKLNLENETMNKLRALFKEVLLSSFR